MRSPKKTVSLFQSHVFKHEFFLFRCAYSLFPLNLQMAMRNPNMSPAKFKTLLEDFQQTIFALGTDVYQQANDDNLKAEDLTNINITQEYPHPVNATQVPRFNIDLDEENNSQADYETIE